MVKPLSILDQMFYTTIRLNGLDYDKNEITGTGFFFNYRSGVRNHLFLVTNSHTINEMNKCTLTFHRRKRGKPDKGNVVKLKASNFSQLWHHHPKKIDLAIMPISPIDKMLVEQEEKIYVQSIDDDLIPTEQEIEDEIQPLEDAYFIGYPNGVYDKVNYIPVARKGTVATPLTLDFEGKPWFLFDGAAFPGSSGSPIIMVDQNGYIDRENNFIPKRRIYFLGIMSSCYTFTDKRGKYRNKTEKELEIYRQMMDLGVGIKSSALLEMVKGYLNENRDHQVISKVTTRIRHRLGMVANRFKEK